jgi:hypothetical protein
MENSVDCPAEYSTWVPFYLSVILPPFPKFSVNCKLLKILNVFSGYQVFVMSPYSMLLFSQQVSPQSNELTRGPLS